MLSSFSNLANIITNIFPVEIEAFNQSTGHNQKKSRRLSEFQCLNKRGESRNSSSVFMIDYSMHAIIFFVYPHWLCLGRFPEEMMKNGTVKYISKVSSTCLSTHIPIS